MDTGERVGAGKVIQLGGKARSRHPEEAEGEAESNGKVEDVGNHLNFARKGVAGKQTTRGSEAPKKVPGNKTAKHDEDEASRRTYSRYCPAKQEKDGVGGLGSDENADDRDTKVR